jgi:endo-1,4-beta-xylanase
MKKGLLLITAVAVALLFSVTQVAKADGTGWDHGYYWSLYHSGGSASISFSGAGTYAGNYAISWSNVGDVVGGKGWNPGSGHSCNYNCGALSGTWKFFGVYGWTTGPLIEYYVTEMGSASGTDRTHLFEPPRELV